MFLGSYYNDLGIYLYLTPTICSFFAAFALLARRKALLPQIYLAIYFITLGLGIGFSFVYDRYLAFNHNEILRSVHFIMTAWGCLAVLLYFVALMQPYRLTRRYILSYTAAWLIFSLLILLLDAFSNHFKPITDWKEIFDNLSSPTVLLRFVASLSVMICEVSLALFVIKMYRNHRRFIRENYSYKERVDLRWIGAVVFLFIIVAFSDMLWMINASVEVKTFFNIMALIVICGLFWLGSRQGEIPLLPDLSEEENKSPSTEKSTLVESGYKQAQLKAKLLEYFRNEKPFLNPELTLSDVAENIGVSHFYLSRFINREFEMNFYSLINGYRIDYVISLIEQDRTSVTGDMLFAASGFKTRSVFFKHFREKTGYSPQEYIKRLNASQ